MPSNPPGQIDDDAVRRYFAGAGGDDAATVSMMAHEHDLPASASSYRRKLERRAVAEWLHPVGAHGRILDVGCGAGAWSEFFAQRCAEVVALEQSPMMVIAARERLGRLPNVEVIHGDCRNDIPGGKFDMIFVGGVCMYLNDADVIRLLRSLEDKLSAGGVLVLRESTMREDTALTGGTYQVLYRSVGSYRKLIREAGPFTVNVRRNYGYTSVVTAEGLVELRRKWMTRLPENSALLGSLTWWTLRASAPLSFWALPRLLTHLGITWPKLQNHFFGLQAML